MQPRFSRSPRPSFSPAVASSRGVPMAGRGSPSSTSDRAMRSSSRARREAGSWSTAGRIPTACAFSWTPGCPPGTGASTWSCSPILTRITRLDWSDWSADTASGGSSSRGWRARVPATSPSPACSTGTTSRAGGCPAATASPSTTGTSGCCGRTPGACRPPRRRTARASITCPSCSSSRSGDAGSCSWATRSRRSTPSSSHADCATPTRSRWPTTGAGRPPPRLSWRPFARRSPPSLSAPGTATATPLERPSPGSRTPRPGSSGPTGTAA